MTYTLPCHVCKILINVETDKPKKTKAFCSKCSGSGEAMAICDPQLTPSSLPYAVHAEEQLPLFHGGSR